MHRWPIMIMTVRITLLSASSSRIDMAAGDYIIRAGSWKQK
jgi:hypothetical protein